MIPIIDIHSHRDNQLDDGLRIHQFNVEKPKVDGLFSVSIHPWDVDKSLDFNLISANASVENCLAIGETGLDKFYPEYEKQMEVFRDHIQLAKTLKKPLIIHCVKAFEDCLRILKEEAFTGGVLFHGFNKHPQLAQQLIKNGFFLGLGSHFLKENPNFDRFFSKMEFKQVIFETDNNPEISIKELYQKAENLCPKLDVKAIIYKNFKDWKTK